MTTNKSPGQSSRPVVQQDPAYHSGFYDAQGHTPLFDDASPPYAAGWHAYWSCREILEKIDREH